MQKKFFQLEKIEEKKKKKFRLFDPSKLGSRKSRAASREDRYVPGTRWPEVGPLVNGLWKGALRRFESGEVTTGQW